MITWMRNCYITLTAENIKKAVALVILDINFILILFLAYISFIDIFPNYYANSQDLMPEEIQMSRVYFNVSLMFLLFLLK